jgi:hypothetical protein
MNEPPASVSGEPDARARQTALKVGGGWVVVAVLGGFIQSGSTNRIFESIDEGGSVMWVLLLGGALALAISLAHGVIVIRRPAWPSWPPLLLAAGISLLAWLAVAQFGQMVQEAASGAMHASQKDAIIAAGWSEALHVSRLGSWIASILLALAALLSGARALARVPATAFRGRAVLLALVGGGSAVALSTIPLLTEGYAPGVMASAALAGALCGIAGAAIGTMALMGTPQAGNEAHDLAAGDALLAAITGAAACVLGAVSSAIASMATVLQVAAAKSVAPSQKASIAAAAMEELGTLSLTNATLLLPLIFAIVVVTTARPGSMTRAVNNVRVGIALALFMALPAGLMWVQASSVFEHIAGAHRLTEAAVPGKPRR